MEFQSTHPLRGATMLFCCTDDVRNISIHAPLAGCDVQQIAHTVDLLDFNPRTPCGVRRILCGFLCIAAEFQSTHPLRGATKMTYDELCQYLDFNPRTPCGVRRLWKDRCSIFIRISIHAPLAGCDATFHYNTSIFRISIHAPLAGCDEGLTLSPTRPTKFQSTHPLRGATAKAHKKMRHFCAKGINTSSLCAKNAHPATLRAHILQKIRSIQVRTVRKIRARFRFALIGSADLPHQIRA